MKKHTILMAILAVASLACAAVLAPQAVPALIGAGTVVGLAAAALVTVTRSPLANTVNPQDITTHREVIPLVADAALSSPYLLLKRTSTGVDIAGVSDEIFGVSDEATYDAGDIVNVQLVGPGRTLKVKAGGAITAGAAIYQKAGGKVQALPVAAGTYLRAGIAVTAAGAGNDYIEAQVFSAGITKTVS